MNAPGSSHSSPLLPRALEAMLEQGLRALPVVVVTGARQTGKSTLVRSLSPGRDRLYVTLDDLDVQEQAQKAPEDLVRRANRMTLDEVQRSPDLLRTIKRVVDQDREAGRFILTGSANLLMMRQVSESLAGRAVYLNLWPLTRREQLGLGQTGIWSALLETPCSKWPDLVANTDAPEESWRERVLRGGFPTPSHEMHDARDRALWFDGYIRTYLERDLLELSAIDQLADFRRLMRAAGLRVGSLLNQAEIARDVTLPPSTAQRYLNLLEISYQMVRLPAYAVNRTKRLTKSPKVYWNDTALALHLAGEVEPRGAHLENLVFGDLLAWQSGRVPRPEILYWRTSKGAEVDFVIESGNRLLPIEVKSSRQVRYGDVNHLKVFMHEYADLVSGGLLLYDGVESYWVAERILAVPWWKVI